MLKNSCTTVDSVLIIAGVMTFHFMNHISLSHSLMSPLPSTYSMLKEIKLEFLYSITFNNNIWNKLKVHPQWNSSPNSLSQLHNFYLCMKVLMRWQSIWAFLHFYKYNAHNFAIHTETLLYLKIPDQSLSLPKGICIKLNVIRHRAVMHKWQHPQYHSHFLLLSTANMHNKLGQFSLDETQTKTVTYFVYRSPQVRITGCKSVTMFKRTSQRGI